jgi:hypothetical protein
VSRPEKDQNETCSTQNIRNPIFDATAEATAAALAALPAPAGMDPWSNVQCWVHPQKDDVRRLVHIVVLAGGPLGDFELLN